MDILAKLIAEELSHLPEEQRQKHTETKEAFGEFLIEFMFQAPTAVAQSIWKSITTLPFELEQKIEKETSDGDAASTTEINSDTEVTAFELPVLELPEINFPDLNFDVVGDLFGSVLELLGEGLSGL